MFTFGKKKESIANNSSKKDIQSPKKFKYDSPSKGKQGGNIKSKKRQRQRQKVKKEDKYVKSPACIRKEKENLEKNSFLFKFPEPKPKKPDSPILESPKNFEPQKPYLNSIKTKNLEILELPFAESISKIKKSKKLEQNFTDQSSESSFLKNFSSGLGGIFSGETLTRQSSSRKIDSPFVSKPSHFSSAESTHNVLQKNNFSIHVQAENQDFSVNFKDNLNQNQDSLFTDFAPNDNFRYGKKNKNILSFFEKKIRKKKETNGKLSLKLPRSSSKFEFFNRKAWSQDSTLFDQNFTKTQKIETEFDLPKEEFNFFRKPEIEKIAIELTAQKAKTKIKSLSSQSERMIVEDAESNQIFNYQIPAKKATKFEKNNEPENIIELKDILELQDPPKEEIKSESQNSKNSSFSQKSGQTDLSHNSLSEKQISQKNSAERSSFYVSNLMNQDTVHYQNPPEFEPSNKVFKLHKEKSALKKNLIFQIGKSLGENFKMQNEFIIEDQNQIDLKSEKFENQISNQSFFNPQIQKSESEKIKIQGLEPEKIQLQTENQRVFQKKNKIIEEISNPEPDQTQILEARNSPYSPFNSDKMTYPDNLKQKREIYFQNKSFNLPPPENQENEHKPQIKIETDFFERIQNLIDKEYLWEHFIKTLRHWEIICGKIESISPNKPKNQHFNNFINNFPRIGLLPKAKTEKQKTTHHHEIPETSELRRIHLIIQLLPLKLNFLGRHRYSLYDEYIIAYFFLRKPNPYARNTEAINLISSYLKLTPVALRSKISQLKHRNMSKQYVAQLEDLVLTKLQSSSQFICFGEKTRYGLIKSNRLDTICFSLHIDIFLLSVCLCFNISWGDIIFATDNLFGLLKKLESDYQISKIDLINESQSEISEIEKIEKLEFYGIPQDFLIDAQNLETQKTMTVGLFRTQTKSDFFPFWEKSLETKKILAILKQNQNLFFFREQFYKMIFDLENLILSKSFTLAAFITNFGLAGKKFCSNLEDFEEEYGYPTKGKYVFLKKNILNFKLYET